MRGKAVDAFQESAGVETEDVAKAVPVRVARCLATLGDRRVVGNRRGAETVHGDAAAAAAAMPSGG
jgi:hypothetical protein